MNVARLIVSSLALGLLAGCGGGGTAKTTGALTCGPTYKTPNYILAKDPSSGIQNDLRYWANFPVKVFIGPEIIFEDNGVVVNTTTMQTDAALQRWTTAAGSTLFTKTSESQAQITITFNELPEEPGPGATLGRTIVTYYPSNNQLVSAEIIVNTWVGMTKAEFNGLRQTITHEFGHALFLQGHSDVEADTMFWQSDPSTDAPLTTRDKNSFETAYCGDFSDSLVSREVPNEKPVTKVIICK